MMKRILTITAAMMFAGFSGPEDPKVTLDVSMGTPVMLAGNRQVGYMKIGLTGFELERSSHRPPVNLAIVLDRSSSMSGEKIEKAKEAALMVVDRLGDGDIISVVAYDSYVEVLVPAQPLTDKNAVRKKIRSIQPSGSTALFAGVSRGIEEVRKYLDSNRVKRVLLLSDGQANVGPSSPNELGRLGQGSAKEGIAITTVGLGLGYNEDLMAQLAAKSDGNHAFAETPQELTKIFDYELGDVLSVVAQEVAIKVQLADGVRPVRVLNRAAEIAGQTVVLTMNQLYSKQEKYFLLEVELGSAAVSPPRIIGNVDVSYANSVTGKTDRLSSQPTVAFTASHAEVEQKMNHEVMVAVAEAVATDTNRQALLLRDEGKVKEAQRVLLDNSTYLRTQAQKYKSKKLDDYGKINFDDANNLEEERWVGTRKRMRKSQHENDSQQSY